MFRGTLIRESLRDDSVIGMLDVTNSFVVDVPGHTLSQPLSWTIVEFQTATADATATALSAELMPGPWYIDMSSELSIYIVFSSQVFSYRRGDMAGRAAAERHALSVGVPTSQIDWGETASPSTEHGSPCL